jgi:hypothetical protein
MYLIVHCLSVAKVLKNYMEVILQPISYWLPVCVGKNTRRTSTYVTVVRGKLLAMKVTMIFTREEGSQ